MFKKLKTVTLRIIASVNILAILLMLASAYSDRLYPAEHPYLACFGLAFPILLLVNLLFLAFWVLIHFRYVFLPVLGFLACLPSIKTYLPLNPKSEQPPKSAIKVLTYNVQGFVPGEGKTIEKGDGSKTLDYIYNADANILCLQEANEPWQIKELIHKKLYDMYPYHDSIAMNTGSLVSIFTTYPILAKQRINYESKSNGSAAFTLLIGRDTVIVINNHFENCHLDTTQRREYTTIIKGEMGKEEASAKSKQLITRLAESAKIRCKQADSVEVFIETHRDKSIILCGDFNDNPISYTRYRLSTMLTDCFRETGNGLGLSYNKYGFPVRIDYIMCSKDWKPYKCKIDAKLMTSDHFPMCCWLKKQ